MNLALDTLDAKLVPIQGWLENLRGQLAAAEQQVTELRQEIGRYEAKEAELEAAIAMLKFPPVVINHDLRILGKPLASPPSYPV